MESNLIKENARLRREVCDYQNAMEELEVRARRAEARAKDLARVLAKFRSAVTAAAQAAAAPEHEEQAAASPPPRG